MIHQDENGRWVPDPDDYPSLGELFARPTAWTEEELVKMRSRLVSMRDALSVPHPRDPEHRASMLRLIARVEDAIRIAESTPR